MGDTNPQTWCKNARTDPTVNVTNILHEAVKRQDDLLAVHIEHIKEKFLAIDGKFAAVDVKYQIQFNAAEKAIAIAQTAQEKLVASALDGTKEAINKADVATDKRFSLLSEKIDNVGDTVTKNTGAQGIYVTHSDLSNEMEKIRTYFDTMLRPVITFMNSQQGASKGTNMVWVYIGIGIAALSGLTALILNALRLSGLGLQ